MLSLKFKKEKPVFLCISIHMYECTHTLYFIEMEYNDYFLKDNRLHFNTSCKNLMMFFYLFLPQMDLTIIFFRFSGKKYIKPPFLLLKYQPC